MTNQMSFFFLDQTMMKFRICCALPEYISYQRHPLCFRRTRRTAAAVLRGVQAAGVALCYGNNNGGVCAAGSVHPLAPNVARSSPRLFSCPARLSNTPSPPLSFYSLPRLLCPPHSSFSLHFSRFLLLSISSHCTRAPPVYFSSQFHPFFFAPQRRPFNPEALRGEQNVH